ncbi:hypothetical protein [Aestuariivirga sp.]|uniref:hypothetical protein n=1 Tax=Aestuariivirga sp. TaxID=2650926 RepID=UPI0039E2F95B
MTHFINIALIAITTWFGLSVAWTALPILLVWFLPSVIIVALDSVWGVDETWLIKLPGIVWAPGVLLLGPVIAAYCAFDGDDELAWGIMSDVMECVCKPFTPMDQMGGAK